MRWGLAILLLGWSLPAGAHEVRPAYLELTEHAPRVFDVVWKVPALGGLPLAGENGVHDLAKSDAPTEMMSCGCPAPTVAQLSRGVLPVHPAMPRNSEILLPLRSERLQGAEIQRWSFRAPQGLDGWEVTVHGLSATMVDVLVRIVLHDGRVISRLLRPDAPGFVFAATEAGPAAGGYFRLGVEHILFGVDHLLFVLCLLLLVRGPGPILKTITAFTIAHSVTLALATLGCVQVPSGPVEATIALSIVFLATEIAKRREGAPGLTERKPWVVAFTFGLLHGFGFAGALSEVGLPALDIPLALLLFNLGVEAGQLLFVCAALCLVAALRRMASAPVWLRPVPAYAIGSVASFWLVARVVAIW